MRSMNMIFVQSMMSFLFLCTLSGNVMADAHNHTTHDKTPLYFSFITTFTGTFISSGAIPIVDKALDQINSRTDILENYTLNYTTILDSKCSSSPSLNAFFDHFNNKSQPTYITSLCCGCSTATIPVAEISHQWNVPHVSFAAAASVLSDQERFRTFFQLFPFADGSADVYAKIFTEFGWTQVLTVTLQERLFTSITEEIKAKSAEQGVVIRDVPIQLGDYPYDDVFNTIIIDGNYRVMILRMYESYVIFHLCEAHRRNMKYPDYVYITFGGFTQEWWKRYPESTLPCSHSAIEEMVTGSLSILSEGYLPTQGKLNNTTSFGQNIDTFLDEYRSLLKLPQYSHYPDTALVGVAYDAIWSIALGLDIAAKKIAAGNDSGCGHLPGDLVPLEQFDYYNQRLGCIMVQSMEEVTFTGVTRDFNLIDRGSTDKRIRSLYQERLQTDGHVSKKLIGSADDDRSNPLHLLPGESTQTLWGLSKPPYDGASVKRFIPVHVALQVVAYVLAICGFAFVLVCFIFSLVFRKKKIIKLASPNLNYIVLGGSVMLFLSVFLYAYSTNDYSNIEIHTGICNVEFLLFSLGYTSCFAVILSKQWRIYYIFNKPTSKKKPIRDWHLLIIIIVIVVMDLLVLVVGMSMDNLRLKAEIIPRYTGFITTSSKGIREMNFVLQCNSRDASVWLLVSFLYKGSLQILAIFMAFHTRKVKIKALNDSKEITAIIYISTIVLILLAVTEFVLVSFVEIFAALFSLGVIIQACIFTGVIFIPKMIGMYLDPEGNHIFRESSVISSDRSAIEAKMGGGSRNNDVDDLKARIELLECQLNEQRIRPELATPTACNDCEPVSQTAEC